jgi:hypothetical protein
VDPSKFKAPVFYKAELERIADELRSKYPSIQKLPIDVLGFAEFDLGLEFEYAAIQQIGLDAILRPDLKGIIFDKWIFTQAPQHQRLRFSAAHELAHLFLHREIYGKLHFKTVKQWIAFIDAIPVREYQWIEWQADEFAGHFLMPTAQLSGVLDETISDAEREGFFSQGTEEVLDFCCRAMHGHFDVSFAAMQTRIRKSKFWPPSDLRANPN